MNLKKASRMIGDILLQFDLEGMHDSFLKIKPASAEDLYPIAESIGISREHLDAGIAPVPNRLYKKYPLFEMLSDWRFASQCSGRYGSLRLLKALFGDKCTLEDVPTEQEERELLLASVGERAHQKLFQINELFPGTYPLELPARFSLRTSNFIDFPKVYEMVESFNAVIKRFSELFFAAIQSDLPENEVCELNLLSTFLHAADVLMPSKGITYRHIQTYRAPMREDGYTRLESYVRIKRSIPFWKAREFYQNADSFIAYVEQHANAKQEIRSFLTLVTSYECIYMFIKDMDEHLRREKMTEEERMEEDVALLCASPEDPPEIYIYGDPILVSKETGEIDETDRLIAERGQALLKHVYREYEPDSLNPSDDIDRLKRRFDVMISARSESNRVSEDGDDNA